MQYRVLPGHEWFSLAKVYKAGEVVELPAAEGAPFVGRVLELIAIPVAITVTIPEQTVTFGKPSDAPESAPAKPKPAKKSKKAKP